MDGSDAILYLRGVFVEDLYVDQDDCDTDEETDEESEFDVLPTTFHDITSWTTETNVRCANCCLEHDNPPVPIPNYMTTIDGVKLIQVERISCCGFACAMTYLTENYDRDECDKRTQLLQELYYKFTGNRIYDIPCAPRRTEIDVYGGATAKYNTMKFRQHISRLCPVHLYLN